MKRKKQTKQEYRDELIATLRRFRAKAVRKRLKVQDPCFYEGLALGYDFAVQLARNLCKGD